MTYRTPTDRERSFLRIIVRGNPELERQVESCEISDYDPTGYYEVRVLDGPPSPQPPFVPIDGPRVAGDPKVPYFEILLWTDDRGLLYSIEILDFGGVDTAASDGAIDPVEIVNDAARAIPPRIGYPTSI